MDIRIVEGDADWRMSEGLSEKNKGGVRKDEVGVEVAKEGEKGFEERATRLSEENGIWSENDWSGCVRVGRLEGRETDEVMRMLGEVRAMGVDVGGSGVVDVYE